MICVGCASEFQPSPRNHRPKYCSPQCSGRHWRTTTGFSARNNKERQIARHARGLRYGKNRRWRPLDESQRNLISEAVIESAKRGAAKYYQTARIEGLYAATFDDFLS